MIKRLVLLMAGSLAFWVLVAIPLRLVRGDQEVVYTAVAVLLCLVPTAATLVWSGWALRGPPERQLLLVLGGSGTRLFFVLLSGLTIYVFVPYFQQPAFWLWVLVFYLFTLALEMVLLLAGRPAPGD